ncbi:MAG: polysaccharide biosynthesis C-terminal domain-containing protein [Patescibacteria group bacterium]
MRNKSFVGKHGSLGEFLIKGESVTRMWDLVGSAFSLINSFFIIQALSLYQFGLYQLVLAFIGLVNSFNLDLFDTVVNVEIRRYFNSGKIAVAKRILKEYAVVKIVVAILMTIGVFLGANLVAHYYGSDVAQFIRIASFIFLITTFQNIEMIVLKNSFSMIYYSAGGIREVFKFFLLFGVVFYSYLDISKILVIHILGLLGSLVFTSFFFWRIYSNLWLKVISAKGFFLNGLAKAHGKWVSLRFLLAKFSSGNINPWLIKFFINTEAVAIYFLAYNLVAFIQEFFPVNALSWIFLMKIDDKNEMGYIFKRSAKYLFWFGVLAGLFSLAAVPWIVNIIFPKFHDAWPIFKVMLVVFPIFGVYKIIKEVLSTLREYKTLTLRMPIESLVNLIFLAVLLPLFGLMGAAIAYVAVYVARILFFYPALIRLHPNFKIKTKDIFSFNDDDIIFIKKIYQKFLSTFRSFFLRYR